MFYALLVIPHLLAIAGLLAFAYRTEVAPVGGRPRRDEDDRPDGGPPPRAPDPGPGGGGIPLADAAAPRRRVRVGGRLAELHPRRARRGHLPEPQRTPVKR